MPSSPPPDRFQREIDDIIRIAERRLEHQSFRYRMRRSTRRLGNAVSAFNLRLPPAETLGGWGLALLLISWLLTLPFLNLPLIRFAQPWVLMLGIVLLTAGLVRSLVRGKGTAGAGGASAGGGGGGRMWRGERIAYGSPYGESWLSRLRRMFRSR
jgi:hypothetical protein